MPYSGRVFLPPTAERVSGALPLTQYYYNRGVGGILSEKYTPIAESFEHVSGVERTASRRSVFAVAAGALLAVWLAAPLAALAQEKVHVIRHGTLPAGAKVSEGSTSWTQDVRIQAGEYSQGFITPINGFEISVHWKAIASAGSPTSLEKFLDPYGRRGKTDATDDQNDEWTRYLKSKRTHTDLGSGTTRIGGMEFWYVRSEGSNTLGDMAHPHGSRWYSERNYAALADGSYIEIQVNVIVPYEGSGLDAWKAQAISVREKLTFNLPSAIAEAGPKKVSLGVKPNPVAADGTATAEAVFRCLDDKGKPVGGVALDWQLGPRLAPSELGTLVKTDAATGADGTARAIYQAPLLEARSMQEIGEIKNRKIAVVYRLGNLRGECTVELGLLRTALVDLVIEKPGVALTRLPIRIGSLNGTLRGRLVLRAQHLPNTNVATQEPLYDATLRLDSPLLTWATIEKATTDKEGRFVVAMKMTNWPAWSKTFAEPMVMRPSEEFMARQKRVSQGLREWDASPEVKSATLELVSESQSWIAGFDAKDAGGLSDKLQLLGWMLLVLKDGKAYAADSAGEFLGHAWSLLQSAAGYFYEDSRLAKWVDGKYQYLEKMVGLRDLQTIKARWVKNLAGKGGMRDSLFAWLSHIVLGREPGDAALETGGRFRRSMLDKVLLPAVVGHLADALVEFTPEMPMPDFSGFLTGKLIEPYVEAGNADLALFVNNTDYEQIADVSSALDARLAARKEALVREQFQLAHWRIAEDMVQSLVANASECSQAFLKVMAATLAAPELVEMAKKLEKLHQAIDSVATAARFAEECYRFVAILAKSEETVINCVAEAQGLDPQSASAAAAGGPAAAAAGAGIALLPVAHAAGASALDLTAGFDWAAFELRAGRIRVEALTYLAVLEPAQGAWRAEALPGLLGVAETDPEALRALLAREEEWHQAMRAVRYAALPLLDASLSSENAGLWTAAVARLKDQTVALQAEMDRVSGAAEHLQADPGATLRQAIRERQKRQPSHRIAGGPIVPWLGAATGWAISVALLLLVVLGLAGMAMAVKRLRAGSARTPAADKAPTTRLLGAVKALVDGEGRTHVLSRECTTLGFAADNDVVLASNEVSRHHARVWRTQAGTCWIEDLGSRNGTFVGGERVTSAWLYTGDPIQLGQEILRVE
ncbi:MAG: FHA domain-containing protein [Acidobacteria bacterium]|nr:FHA domain-containing protein [Acidobacteriota bacterium]